LVYVGFRFEWQFGVAAVCSLVHDVVSTVGLFSLTGMQFDLTALAAVLMLAGYSVNDTVVIFDRIREMLKKYRKTPLGDVLNISINSTLARTTRTSVVVLLTLIALWLFGGEALRVFTNAMIFGIVLGTYSSIFVAAPILLYLKLRPAAAPEMFVSWPRPNRSRVGMRRPPAALAT
jgi:preprotein translocase subunit SecF